MALEREVPQDQLQQPAPGAQEYELLSRKGKPRKHFTEEERRAAQRQDHKRYEQTEKGKATRKRYAQSEKGKEAQKRKWRKMKLQKSQDIFVPKDLPPLH